MKLSIKSLQAAVPVLLLAACAQAPVKSPADAPMASSPPPAGARGAARESVGPLPGVDLSSGLLYELMAAEVANQRGYSATAYSKFLELAQRTRDPRLARRAAEIASEDRDDEKALRAVSLWVETDPDNIEARLNLARLLLAGGRGEEAAPHLEKLLSAGGVNVTDVFAQINRLLARNPNRQSTLTIIQGLAAKYPNVPEARIAVARAAAAAGNDELAISEARAASRLKPDWDVPVLMSAQLLTKRSPAEASAELKRFLDTNPKATEVELAYARSLIGEKKYPEALAQFQRVEKAAPGNPDVLYALGLLALDARDYKNAEAYLKKLLAADEVRDKNLVYIYLGQMADEQKKYAEARNWWQQVGRGDQYLPAQVRIAQSFAKEGRVPEGRTFLQSVATTSNQQRVQMILAEAQLLREAKQDREAFDLLQAGLDKLPNHPDLLYESAMTAEKLSRLDVQETQLKKLIQLKPDYAHAYNALGYSLADRNERLAEAKDLIEKALKIAPDDAAIIDSMGWVLYRLGDLPRAIELLKRAYEMRPDAEIAAHLGEVLWAANRRPEAERIWREALAKTPDDIMLKNTISRLKR